MTDLRLYHWPRSRSSRPRWLLEELGVEYALERVALPDKAHWSEAYRANVHPLGRVPALADGDVTIWESQAICLYLADEFADRGLAPPVGDPQRGPYLQWCAFASVTLDRLMEDLAAARKKKDPADELHAELDECFQALDAGLNPGPFLLGERFTAADVLVGSLVMWARSLRARGSDRERIAAWSDALRGRDAYRAAMKA